VAGRSSRGRPGAGDRSETSGHGGESLHHRHAQPDGQPDLQGFWTNSTYTPLQRPNSVTKEFYTPEEVAAAEKARG
jgi:hypothetical protein